MAERTPLYLDFEAGQILEFGGSDTMPAGNSFLLPVDYIIARANNVDPATDIGYGSWASIGTQVIGAVTVYYFQRTD